MKRPLFVVGAAYFAATRLAFQAGDTLALRLSAAALLTAALCFLLRDKRRGVYTACAVFLTAAVACAGFWVYMGREVAPLRELHGKSATIEGLVTEVDAGPSSTSYTVKAAFPEYPELPSDVQVVIRSVGEIEYGAGDVIRCRVSLASAPDTLWYRSRGIALTGRNARSLQSIPVGRHRLERALIRLRDLMARNLYARLSGQNAGVVSAMVLGMKNDIPPGVYAAVGRSGTSHLLSISGLHLSILCAFSQGLLDRLRCPKRLGAAVTILLAFLFTALVGFAASVFRSFVMTAVTLSGRVISRRGDSLSSLGLALLICGVFRPHWTLGWGLWLSACSTLGIILFGGRVSAALYEGLKRNRPALDRFVRAAANAGGISIAAYVFTLPVLLLMSGWLSLIAPLANILVAPFIPAAILGGVACAVLPGASAPVRFIAWLTDLAVSVIIRVSEILSRLPFAIAPIDESWLLIWLCGLCTVAIALFVYRADKKLVSYGLALLLLSFSAGDLSLAGATRGRIELVTLSPHNAAVLLRDGEAVILGTPDAYEISNLLKYLNFRGVHAIPAVIATDCGEQVGSGLLRLADEYRIDCVIGPNDAYIVSMLEEALPGSLVYAGGYAEITALGGAVVSADIQSGDIHIRVGKNQVVKSRADCDIINTPLRPTAEAATAEDGQLYQSSADGIIEPGTGNIEIYNGGTMLLPGRVVPVFEPVGAYLFGESRLSLAVGGTG